MTCLLRPDLLDDESDASSELPKIFSNEALETDSVTIYCDNEDKSEFYEGGKRDPRYNQRRGKNGRYTPGLKLSKDTIVKIEDISLLVLTIVTTKKNLCFDRRQKATIYIEDVAEFARVFLLYYQLAAITSSRPRALLNLRYRDLILTLVRDLNSHLPRLFIYIRPEFTKSFLSKKESNTFPIPEVIFDPTLVLSPHVFLLGLLFRIGAFKTLSKDGRVINYLENLYSLRLRYRIKRRGEITGFKEVTKPYSLRYGAAKAFNNSHNCLRHTRLEIAYTFCLLDKSVYRSALEDSSSINQIPRVITIEEFKQAREQARDFLVIYGNSIDDRYYKTKKWISYYNLAIRDLRNEKGRQRNRLIRKNLERYKNEQLVIDSERQLSGKMVDEEVKYITLIDTVLTIPGTTVKKEYKRRIAIINIVITKRAHPRGLVSPKNAPPMLLICHWLLPCLKGRIQSLYIRATIYFPRLSLRFTSLSRHFVNKHIKPFLNNIRFKCSIYGEKLESKSRLLNHTERVHRTVSRSSRTALSIA
ncbi:hypothetical protein N7499_005433 [Penicillium canescens]|nr:hypothetical protein N7499_005433 [Penicillium canescens]